MMGFLKNLFATRKQSPRRRRQSCRLEVEMLETRLVPAYTGTKLAVLDFGGVNLSEGELLKGGWQESGAHVTAFKELFTADHPFLDFNHDGAVNDVDANLAINMIVAKVKADFAPYDLDIVVGSWSNYSGLFTDDTGYNVSDGPGDVMVFVSGQADDGYDESSYAGISPRIDLGNEHDDIVFANGGVEAWFFTTDTDLVRGSKFINGLAGAISQEMGHSFGLAHAVSDPSGDADPITHHIMFGADRDNNHDFNFQDRTYKTDLLGPYIVTASANHPEFNSSDLQNAHQMLSLPDVLGPSKHSWVAVLKPGEVTVVGDNAANSIVVKNGPGSASWLVTIDGQLTLVDLGHQPVTTTLNPFAQSLSAIRIRGLGGNDVIAVDAAIKANVTAFGGLGNDTITGGGGNDYLYGGGDIPELTKSSTLIGAFQPATDGDDILKGGGGSDTLYGGTGNDHLYGGGGRDSLFGQDGDDYLDGGNDGAVDRLTGGTGADTFIVWVSSVNYLNHDSVLDRATGDTVIGRLGL